MKIILQNLSSGKSELLEALPAGALGRVAYRHTVLTDLFGTERMLVDLENLYVGQGTGAPG